MEVDSKRPKQIDFAEKRKKIKLCAARRWSPSGFKSKDNDAWKSAVRFTGGADTPI